MSSPQSLIQLIQGCPCGGDREESVLQKLKLRYASIPVDAVSIAQAIRDITDAMLEESHGYVVVRYFSPGI